MKKEFLLLVLAFTISLQSFSQMPQPLGHGVRTTGQITCFAYDSINNRLYAGGYFENIGGIETPNIAYYDGTNWHAMGDGLPGYVSCMKVLNGNLYAGGSFTQTGNVKLNNIAMWNGTQWSAVGNSIVTNYTVMGMEVYKNELYLSAFLAMGVGATGVGKFDGTNWSVVANSNSTNATIHIQAINDTLFILGNFQSLNGITLLNIAGYDGTNFYDYNFPASANLIVEFKNTLYASGGNSYYHFDGTSWINNGAHGLQYPLLFTFKDSLYATFLKGGTTTDTMEIWNFTNGIQVQKIGYTTYPMQVQASINSAIVAYQKAFVGGIFYNMNGQPIVTSSSYDGFNFQQFAGASIAYMDPWLNSSISTMAFDSLTGNIYAGGSFFFAGDTLARNVARWDGTQWHAVGEGFSSTVSKLIFFQDTLYACGRFKKAGNTIVNAISKWNGSSWVAVGSGSSGVLWDMAVFNNELYVAGNFTSFNGMSANYMVKYDGTLWNTVGSNDLDATVYSLAVYNNTICAATNFSFWNFNSNLVQLSGSNWAALTDIPGNGLSIDIFNFNGTLYAASDNVYKYNVGNWQSTNLTNLWSNNGTMFSINNKLITTVSNDGMYQLDTTWKPFQYFIQAYDVIPVNTTDYVIGGFFPYYFDGLKDVYLYNAALLQLKKPTVSIALDHDSICSHQYVFFNAPSSTFPSGYEWHFPGGIPATSTLQFPIVKYNVPGQYDVFLKITNAFGSDSLVEYNKVSVYSCTTEINDLNPSEKLIIYPNPAKDWIHIYCDYEIDHIYLSDCLGKTVANIDGIKTNQYDFDANKINAGIYFLRVQCGDKIFTQK